MQGDELRQLIENRDKSHDVLLVLEDKELELLPKIGRIMDVLEPEGLGILALPQNNCQLFPE